MGWPHTYEVLAVSKEIRERVLARENNVRGFLISRDTSFVDRAHELDPLLVAAQSQIKVLTRDNASQQVLLAKLSALILRWHAQLYAGITENQVAPGTAAFGAEGALKGIVTGLEDVDAEEERLLVDRSQAGAEAFLSAYRINIVGPVMAILAAALLGWTLHRAIATPISALTRAMRRLSKGDTTYVSPRWSAGRERADESSTSCVSQKSSLG